jgi:hypothetical protein
MTDSDSEGTHLEYTFLLLSISEDGREAFKKCCSVRRRSCNNIQDEFSGHMLILSHLYRRLISKVFHSSIGGAIVCVGSPAPAAGYGNAL